MEEYTSHWEQRSEHIWERGQRRPGRGLEAEEWGGIHNGSLDMHLGMGIEQFLEQILGYGVG